MNGMSDAATNVTTDQRQLRRHLVELASAFCDAPESLADSVIDLLAGSGLVSPEVPSVRLLSPQGSLLAELARTPDSTLRNLSVRLGWSEGYVQKVVSQLASAGLVSRTRLGQRVIYTIVRDSVISHADSARIGVLLSSLPDSSSQQEADSSP